MEIPSSSPIIYQSTPTFASNSFKEPLKDRIGRQLGKIILAVLVIGLVIEGIIGIRTLTKPFPRRADATSTIGVGKIVLDSASYNYGVGDTVPVSVRIITSGRATDSTDLILKYDPKVLDATTSAIVQGKLYKEYVIKDVDNNAGVVRISAITPPNTEGFVGIGEFAVINFRAKKDGATQVSVDFTKGSTVDSNLVETGVAIDILDEVFNLNLEIGNNKSEPQPVAESCKGFYQYCHNLVGQTGRQFCKSGRNVENTCVFDPKLSTSCEICRLGF